MRAPSTSGTFRRASSFNHVRQPDNVAAAFRTGPVGRKSLLGGADHVVFLDLDDNTVREPYGYAKQGAGHVYKTKVKTSTRCRPRSARRWRRR